MSLNESIAPSARDAALDWFLLRQGYGGQVGEKSRCARTLTRPLSAGEETREAIRRLNPAIPSRTLATLLSKLLSGELSVAQVALS
jgi:hypothetical protein